MSRRFLVARNPDMASVATALFFEVHRGLPRQGPGDDASTLRALALCTGLPPDPHVLDIGCGPGAQTLALARGTSGTITAVDLHEPFLDELRQRAAVAGVRERIRVMRADMTDLPFDPGSFDLIWAEGSAYIMGITKAFTSWRALLRPRGYLVVSELCWLTDDVPPDARSFFLDAYQGMTDVAGNVARMEACGFELVGHFTLPDASWWTEYYGPLEANLARARADHGDDPTALRLIEATEREIEMRHAHGDSYGYELFVCRLPTMADDLASGRDLPLDVD